jgi:hypothetical protein
MPIIHYPGYIARDEAALRKKVQVRTINDQVTRNSIPYIRVDGHVYIKDLTVAASPPPNVSLRDFVWVPNYARKHHMIPERLYEEIIIGKVTGVVLVNHVYVIASDPELHSFLRSIKK